MLSTFAVVAVIAVQPAIKGKHDSINRVTTVYNYIGALFGFPPLFLNCKNCNIAQLSNSKGYISLILAVSHAIVYYNSLTNNHVKRRDQSLGPFCHYQKPCTAFHGALLNAPLIFNPKVKIGATERESRNGI